MMIRVLGCSGAIAAGYRTTSFLLDDDILIDAGSGVGDLDLDALARIDHILVSHSHLDHVMSIALLADAVLRRRLQAGRPPIQVYALAPTVLALRTHVFNGVIWPDFTRLPSPEQPALRFQVIDTGQQLDLGGRRIEVLSARHTVPAVGFAVDTGPAGWWVYTGDTGPNPELWARLSELKVADLVIETAFGDDEQELAQVSRHLCPSLLTEELTQLSQPTRLHITHVKPGEEAAVMAELVTLETPHAPALLEAGHVFRWG
ncbi:3',5'-cyclic-nucleotide phosphodiesterase [Pelomonas sp. CA6]|uniref:MBL fold metallo-hydrolase n=1 Tax=Pelomonas sp. CA6 TaxID=2907999 RepID=UPI001F4C0BAC|nr:3',5'-cyclic-nucleotide phosphodiesterase [Pelomonas sp. CA6]MCH7343619.1 3',5'-cyclic-nucleotide phosphodiesterase [Pelomonas sp. CA6]